RQGAGHPPGRAAGRRADRQPGRGLGLPGDGAAGAAPLRARLHARGRHPQPRAGGASASAPAPDQGPAAPHMTWPDAAILALRSLGRRGARSLLAGLGVALGTTLLVALLSIAEGADTRI